MKISSKLGWGGAILVGQIFHLKLDTIGFAPLLSI